jgi:hypothetical protein
MGEHAIEWERGIDGNNVVKYAPLESAFRIRSRRQAPCRRKKNSRQEQP